MFQITVAGRLGKNSELRTTQSGKSVLGFSVAVDTGFGDSKKTVWIECALWGERGEKLAQYLTKGASVTIIGEGGLRTWESNGKSGASVTCNVRELTLQGGKRDGDSQGGDRDQGQYRGGGSGWEPPADLDDDIPF